MIDVLSIVFLIFGILQIIFFFKVCGMTNDVISIKRGVSETNDFKWANTKLEILAIDYKKPIKLISNALFLRRTNHIKKFIIPMNLESSSILSKKNALFDFEKYDVLEKIRKVIF